jgi:hypothetical protein
MFYVCEEVDQRPLKFLAGPYATEQEATAAADTIEADSPEFLARTFVWQCGAPPDAPSSASSDHSGVADTTPL